MQRDAIVWTRAVDMVADGAIARFVIHMGRGIDSVQLADAVDRIGTVPEDRAMIGAPRAMGVSSVDASWPGQGPAETPDIRDPAGGPSTILSPAVTQAS